VSAKACKRVEGCGTSRPFSCTGKPQAMQSPTGRETRAESGRCSCLTNTTATARGMVIRASGRGIMRRRRRRAYPDLGNRGWMVHSLGTREVMLLGPRDVQGGGRRELVGRRRPPRLGVPARGGERRAGRSAAALIRRSARIVSRQPEGRARRRIDTGPTRMGTTPGLLDSQVLRSRKSDVATQVSCLCPHIVVMPSGPACYPASTGINAGPQRPSQHPYRARSGAKDPGSSPARRRRLLALPR
jgi:hypothetical protein